MALIEVYRSTVDRRSWAKIGEFVEQTTLAAAPSLTYQPGRVIVAVTHLAMWCQSAGFDLSPEVAFTRGVIDAAVADGFDGVSDVSRATMRTILLRVGELLAPDANPARLRPLPQAPASAPYTRGELSDVLMWAVTQKTEGRRASALALVSLGAGAGLSANEILTVRRRHVEETDGGSLIVHVPGARPRVVPVLSFWCPRLAEVMAASNDDDAYLFRPGMRGTNWNLITHFVEQSDDIGAKPQTRRLRATWIIHHLSRPVYPVELMRAAGVDSLEALTRFTKYVTPLDPESSIASLI